MKKVNMNNIQEAGDYKTIEAGGYICKITAAEDYPDREYLRIEFDIAEGELKDYYKDLNERKGFWGGSFVKSYKTKALPFFKAFCTAVTESNQGFVFDGDKNADEKTLVGKRIGLVLGEEDYIKGDGNMGWRTYVDKTLSVESIRAGKFKVPEYKHLKSDDSAGSSSGENYMSTPTGVEDELPFK